VVAETAHAADALVIKHAVVETATATELIGMIYQIIEGVHATEGLVIKHAVLQPVSATDAILQLSIHASDVAHATDALTKESEIRIGVRLHMHRGIARLRIEGGEG
jgi:hypothetical protein